jgi:hypothetical protein
VVQGRQYHSGCSLRYFLLLIITKSSHKVQNIVFTMYSQKFYKIIQFVCSWTCFASVCCILYDPKTDSYRITDQTRKRNNFGVAINTIGIVYVFLRSATVYASSDNTWFPMCYISCIISLLLWMALALTGLYREDVRYLMKQSILFAQEFHSKLQPI